MNREIKFRARDLVLDKYVDWELLLEGDNFRSVLFDKNFTIEQYTGLKDKNGKEIYEDDKVKFHYFYELASMGGASEGEHELSGIVVKTDFGWGLEAIKGEHWKGYTGYEDGEGSSNIMELMMMSEGQIHEESFEVIGTVHDNPELIK